MAELHFYQCRACQQTMVSTALAVPTKLWRCIACQSPMRRLYSMPVRTEREQQWARYGVVYNPGLSTCDVCGIKLTKENRIDLVGVGQYCSVEHANPHVEAHAAALEHRHD